MSFRNPLRYRIKAIGPSYGVFDAKIPGNIPVGTFNDPDYAELMVTALHFRDAGGNMNSNEVENAK